MNRALLFTRTEKPSDTGSNVDSVSYTLNTLMPPINYSYDNEKKIWCYKRSTSGMIRVFMGTDYFVMTDYVIGPYLEISTDDELKYVFRYLSNYLQIAENTTYYINSIYKNLDVLNVVNIDQKLKLNVLSEISNIPINTNPRVTNILINPLSQTDVLNSRKTIYRQNNKPTVLGSLNSGISYNHIRQGIDSTSRVMTGKCSEINDTITDIYTFSKKFKNISSQNDLNYNEFINSPPPESSMNTISSSSSSSYSSIQPNNADIPRQGLQLNTNTEKLSDIDEEDLDEKTLQSIETNYRL